LNAYNIVADALSETAVGATRFIKLRIGQKERNPGLDALCLYGCFSKPP